MVVSGQHEATHRLSTAPLSSETGVHKVKNDNALHFTTPSAKNMPKSNGH
jgi:hypothetical protein